MDTIGYVFILISLLLLRALAKGRTIKDAPGDLGDAFKALVTGNTAALTAVFQRTGDSNDPSLAVTGTFTNVGPAPSSRGPAILANAERLGAAAKGYFLGASGPSYYDCSGLVYRTLNLMGIYTGPRFTTASFTTSVKVTQVSRTTANIGDIVLWYAPPLTHHMGIVSAVQGTGLAPGDPGAPGANINGATAFYSARSLKDGIGVSPIDGFFKNVTPSFWRVQ